MGEGMEAGKDSPDNISWIADGLKNSSLIWVMDGSYDRKKAKDLCGVGWIIICTNTGFCLTGTILGKIYLSKFVQGRTIRAMRLASPGTGSGGVLQGCGMVRYAML